ncbi:hypothetical protein D3C81_1901170 [compost metagenome]
MWLYRDMQFHEVIGLKVARPYMWSQSDLKRKPTQNQEENIALLYIAEIMLLINRARFK